MMSLVCVWCKRDPGSNFAAIQAKQFSEASEEEVGREAAQSVFTVVELK